MEYVDDFTVNTLVNEHGRNIDNWQQLSQHCSTLSDSLKDDIGKENMGEVQIIDFFQASNDTFSSEHFYRNFVKTEEQLEDFDTNKQRSYYNVLLSSAQRLREYLESPGLEFTQFDVNGMIQNVSLFINNVTLLIPPDPEEGGGGSDSSDFSD